MTSHGHNVRITPWDVITPRESDGALGEQPHHQIIMLLERLHGVDLGSGNLVDSELVAPEISWLQSNDSGRLDLTAASDLVTPAAALLAIGVVEVRSSESATPRGRSPIGWSTTERAPV